MDLVREERAALPKMGDKGPTFVSKALEIAHQNSTFLPRSFEVEVAVATPGAGLGFKGAGDDRHWSIKD